MFVIAFVSLETISCHGRDRQDLKKKTNTDLLVQSAHRKKGNQLKMMLCSCLERIYVMRTNIKTEQNKKGFGKQQKQMRMLHSWIPFKAMPSSERHTGATDRRTVHHKDTRSFHWLSSDTTQTLWCFTVLSGSTVTRGCRCPPLADREPNWTWAGSPCAPARGWSRCY